MRPLLPFAVLLFACSAAIDGELATVRCADEGAYGPPACAPGETCHGGVCAALGEPVGHECANDEDCASPATCADGAQLGLGSVLRCVVPCCSSAECGEPGDGNVCRTMKSGGGSVCWPASDLGEGAGGELQLGDTGPGGACVAASECRSGACDTGRCVDTCCADSSCTASERICRAGQSAVGEGWYCGFAPTEQSGIGECATASDCVTGECVTVEDAKVCLAPCCSSRECGTVELKAGTYQLACALSASGARGCVGRVDQQATLGVGAACKIGNDCRSGLCVDDGDGKFCSDFCCDDASCGDTKQFSCRPRPTGNAWALRCVRN